MLSITACSALLVGLAIGAVRPLEPMAWGLGAAAAGSSAVLTRLCSSRLQAGSHWRGAVTAMALLALLALGAWWASLRLVAPPDPLVELAARTRVTLEGSLASQPAHAGATARFELLAETLTTVDQTRRLEPPARLQVVDWWDGPASQLVLGDRVHLEGQLASSHGQAELLFPRPIRVVGRASQADPRALAASLRARAQAALHASLPEPEGSLAAGLLLGSSRPADPEFRQQLQRSGLGHLLAIDGYKQVLVAGALQALTLRLVGRWRAVPLVLLGITGYTLLTGASPSAVRAALMLGLSLLASLVGRVHDPLLGLLLAADAMTALEPRLLKDLAFQLSFGATLGLILLYPRVRYLLRRVPQPIAEPAGLTLAVSVATLPITLVVFQQVSVVSPLAHIVAVPLVPVVLAAAVVLLAVQPIPTLASPVAALVWLPTHALAQVIAFFGSLPGAAVSTGRLPPAAAAVLALGLIAWGAWHVPDMRDLRRRVRRVLMLSEAYQTLKTPLAIMLAGLMSTGLLLLVRPDGHLHVRRLPVQRGSAVLVRAPGGASALVVKGAVDPRQLADDVREALPVWERSLDVAVVVDPADRPRLEQVLRLYPSTRLADAQQDARLDLGRGAVVDVYGPPSAEVRLSYAMRSLSLTDASGEAGPLLEPDEDEQV